MFKQADAITKQEGYQVDMDFIEQSSVEALLHNRRGSDHDLFDACDHFCQFNSVLDAVGDERHRPFRLDPFRWGRWVTTTTGAPMGWWPPHPWVSSYNLRPATNALPC